jgi:hypothetical protein
LQAVEPEVMLFRRLLSAVNCAINMAFKCALLERPAVWKHGWFRMLVSSLN